MDILSTTINRLERSYISAFKLGADNGNQGKGLWKTETLEIPPKFLLNRYI